MKLQDSGIKKNWVLIIEDDVELLQVLVESIHGESFEVIGVTNFRLAMDKLENQQFDCIVLDLDLGFSSKSGTQLITHLRSSISCVLNRETPIIVCSGNIDTEVISIHREQISAALAKPYKVPDLIAKMKLCIASKAQKLKAGA